VTRRVPRHVPSWPVWMAPAAVGGTWAAGVVASVAVAVAMAARGAERVDAPSVLLLVALTAAASVGIVVALAARIASPLPESFGVRPVPLRLGAAGVGLGIAVVALPAAAAELLGGALGSLPVPVELSEQSRWSRLLGDPDPTVVDPGASAACSVLARALIGPLFAELLLRGFVLPILARRLGVAAAVAVLAPLTALTFAGAGGDAWLLLPGLALGVALCLLYLETASILPGAVLSATWSGFVLGLAFRWGVGDAALLALACSFLATIAGLLASRRAVSSDPPAAGSRATAASPSSRPGGLDERPPPRRVRPVRRWSRANSPSHVPPGGAVSVDKARR
jgi:membrane protease YdiL (CAAX protease family)